MKVCFFNCEICPKFNHDIAKINLKRNILSDKWFKNLGLFLITLFSGRRFSCPANF